MMLVAFGDHKGDTHPDQASRLGTVTLTRLVYSVAATSAAAATVASRSSSVCATLKKKAS